MSDLVKKIAKLRVMVDRLVVARRLELYHGAHTKFTPHVGICLTDDPDAARAYAQQGSSGEIAQVHLDLSNLHVYDVEGYDRDSNDAPGDDGQTIDGADVLVYQDEDEMGRQHMTWRLMSPDAVKAMHVEQVVPAVEEDDDDWEEDDEDEQ